MGEYVPLFVSLFFVLSIFLIVPPIASSFTNELNEQHFFLSPLVGFIANGVIWTLELPVVPDFQFSFNPFSIVGPSTQAYLADSLQAFSYIPNWLAIPMLILISLAFVYSILKILPTT